MNAPLTVASKRPNTGPSTGPRVAPEKTLPGKRWVGIPVQRWRQTTQAGFFLLFVFSPVFDIFRLDLNLKHFILFGYDWTLGLDDFLAGRRFINQ